VLGKKEGSYQEVMQAKKQLEKEGFSLMIKHIPFSQIGKAYQVNSPVTFRLSWKKKGER